MIDPRLSEDEQVERLKAWWKSNGTSVVIGAALGISVIVGVNFWRGYTKTQGEEASARFAELLSATGAESRSIGDELLAEYQNTPYAALSALYLAKLGYEEGNTEQVESMLKWALENAKQPSTQHVARLRLARVYLEQDNVDQAAQLTQVDAYDGFESEYNELIGDIAMSKGDAAAARTAYEKAVGSLPRGSGYSGLLTLKLDHAIGEAAK